MKGLLLKEWYTMKKLIFIPLYFTYVLIMNSRLNFSYLNTILHPCLIISIIYGMLLTFGKNSSWDIYCEILPYSRKQIVNGKYLIVLLMQAAMLLALSITQMIRLNSEDIFTLSEYAVIMMIYFLSTIFPTIILPVIFKFGKIGKVLYYCWNFIFCSLYVNLTNRPFEQSSWSDWYDANFLSNAFSLPILAAACAVSIGLYALSWYLSVMFYTKSKL